MLLWHCLDMNLAFTQGGNAMEDADLEAEIAEIAEHSSGGRGLTSCVFDMEP